jgi:hypothetical protein
MMGIIHICDAALYAISQKTYASACKNERMHLAMQLVVQLFNYASALIFISQIALKIFENKCKSPVNNASVDTIDGTNDAIDLDQ